MGTLSYLQTLFLLLEGSSPLHHLSPSPPLLLQDVWSSDSIHVKLPRLVSVQEKTLYASASIYSQYTYVYSLT